MCNTIQNQHTVLGASSVLSVSVSVQHSPKISVKLTVLVIKISRIYFLFQETASCCCIYCVSAQVVSCMCCICGVCISSACISGVLGSILVSGDTVSSPALYPGGVAGVYPAPTQSCTDSKIANYLCISVSLLAGW